MLQPSFLKFALFHFLPIIFPPSSNPVLSPRAIQSRCGKAHVSSLLDKILFNDWYIFKPATSDAVITVIVHTANTLQGLDRRAPPVHTIVQVYTQLRVSHDQFGCISTCGLVVHSSNPAPQLPLLLITQVPSTSSATFPKNYLNHDAEKQLSANKASSFHDRVQSPSAVMALKSPMLPSPDRNLMSAFSPYSESPTSPAPFRSPITLSRPLYVRLLPNI